MKRRYILWGIGIIGIVLLCIVAISNNFRGNLVWTISVRYEDEYIDHSEISIACDNIDDEEGELFPVQMSETEGELKYSVSEIYDCGRYYVRVTIPGSCIKEVDLQDKDIQYVMGVFVHHEQLKKNKTHTEVEIKKEGNVYKAYFRSNHTYPNGNKEESRCEMDLSKSCLMEVGFGP